MGTSSRWLVLLDFDGTVTTRDADFEIADAVLPPERAGAYQPLADAYERLEIGVLAYFEGYFRLLGLTPDEFATQAARVPLRPGVHSLVAACRARGLELRVVSEGLDVYVVPALRAAGLDHLEISCNIANFDGRTYRVTAAPDGASCARCANCKGEHVRRAHRAGRRVAIVGNGASDLCAARIADVVFARDGLVGHCEREGLAYRRWEHLDEVAAGLAALVNGRDAADSAG